MRCDGECHFFGEKVEVGCNYVDHFLVLQELDDTACLTPYARCSVKYGVYEFVDLDVAVWLRDYLRQLVVVAQFANEICEGHRFCRKFDNAWLARCNRCSDLDSDL